MEEYQIIDKSRKIIPAGTRKITKDIFKNHDYSKQEALALPHFVEEIESDAFKNWKELSELIFFCNITDKIHNNLIEPIKGQLKNVIIGGDVELICAGAFKDCKKLVSVTIGSKVSDIGNEAFSGCTKLEELILNCNIIGSIIKNLTNQIKTLKYITVGDTSYIIGDSAFPECTKLKKINLGRSVLYIAQSAFTKNEKFLFKVKTNRKKNPIRYRH
jgi:hypothetical protein